MPLTPCDASRETRRLAALAPVIPVLIVEDVASAVPLATALVAGGLPVLEVTLRTAAAFDVIREMATVPGAHVGAGTILAPADAEAALAAGARFGVSPGATERLLDAAEAAGLPMLPGAATATEAMRLAERGYDFVKFFPAAAAGGAAYLRSLASPLPKIGFCPTGGIGPSNALDYLRLSNVLCIGGSWVAPADLVARQDWDAVTRLARDAAGLRPE
jgi:2-dehydro-3-deoxyphosphogluconate aldolase/(4S)-4-hydroxy-2-oxoglutarate aldolase